MSTAVGSAPGNKFKNRFANIVACKLPYSSLYSCHAPIWQIPLPIEKKTATGKIQKCF